MIVAISIILVAFIWLVEETEWFTIRLPYGKVGSLEISSLLTMARGIIFFALGLVMFSGQKTLPAILVSPTGQRILGFNANQVKHICKRLPEWKWELAEVVLISPLGKRLRVGFNGLEAERITRRHEGWAWDYIETSL